MKKHPPYDRHVFICMNQRENGHPRGDCASKGAEAVVARFKEQVKVKGLKPQIRAQKAGCLDTCEEGVSVVVYPEATWYAKVTIDDVDEIVERHLLQGQIVDRLLGKRRL